MHKRNSPNISLGQRKSAGALPAYIHDDAIRMITIIGDSVGKSKEKDPCSVCVILFLSCLVVPSHHQVDNRSKCGLLASCLTIFQASLSSSRFCGCALAGGEAHGTYAWKVAICREYRRCLALGNKFLLGGRPVGR